MAGEVRYRTREGIGLQLDLLEVGHVLDNIDAIRETEATLLVVEPKGAQRGGGECRGKRTFKVVEWEGKVVETGEAISEEV